MPTVHHNTMHHRKYNLSILCVSAVFACYGFLTSTGYGQEAAVPAQTAVQETVNLKVDDKTYPIKYNLTGGKIDNMTAMKENSTLLVDITTNDKGTLTIELPRNIMDSKNPLNEDEDYVVFADGIQIGAEQPTTTNQVRTLAIDFENGVEQIEIAGTRVVPEFGSLSTLFLAVSIIALMLATGRYSKFNLLRRS
jgi:hypothetical protein